MRKVKNLVIGGIESKVVNLILIMVLMISLAYNGAIIYQNRVLTQLSAENNEKQEQALTQIAGGVMDAVVESGLNDKTSLQAQLTDEVFHNLAIRVQIMGEYAEKLLSDPEGNPRKEYAAPDSARNGEIVAQTILASDVDEEAVADRIGLAANMSDMMVTLFGASADTNSCFIALPEGAFIVVDDRSASKFSESGEPVVYDCRTRPWYQLAVERETLIFTDVEVDAFTGDIGIVCAMPVYVDGKLAAVVGSDLFLTSMADAIRSSDEDGGFEVVVNGNGHVVFSPKNEGVFQVVESSNASDLRDGTNPELSAMVADAMKGKTGVRLVQVGDTAYYMSGAPMETVGWALLYAIEQEKIDAPAQMLRESYQSIAKSRQKSHAESPDLRPCIG